MMRVEERLRGALVRDAGPLPEALGAWPSVGPAAWRRRARRRRTLALGAGIVALIGAATAALLASAEGTRDPAIVASGPGAPSIVAKIGGNAPGLAVLSPTGEVTRTLAEGRVFEHWGGVSVPADGSSIYTTVDDPTADASCTDIGVLPHVARVPAEGGAPELIAPGAGPTVSGDGRWLAYTTPASCQAPQGPQTVEVMDLTTGVTTRPFADDPRRGIGAIAWSPDGSRLVVTGEDRNADQRADDLIVRREDPTAKPVVVDVPGEFENATYLPDGRLVVVYADGGFKAHHFVTIGSTGRIDERLFTASIEHLWREGYPLPATARFGAGATLSADAHGRLLMAYDNGIVQAWAPGQEKATTIVAWNSSLDTSGAAWLPARSGSPSTTTPDSNEQVPVDAGIEVSLQEVPIPDAVRFAVRDRLVPGTEPVTIEPDHRPSITISRQLDLANGTPHRCIDQQQPTSDSGWIDTSTCDSGPYDEVPTQLLQLFHYPHPDSQADAVVYYVWTQVPPDTSYVTFDSLALRAWARPVHDFVVFPVDAGPTSAVVRAYNGAGDVLAEINVTPSVNGSRSEPLVTEPIQSMQPPWYDLEANLEWCDTAPLKEVGLEVGGDPSRSTTISVFDHATRAPVTFSTRDYCRQTVVLTPDPAGDMLANFTVENGRVEADYFERVTTVNGDAEIVTQGAPIPDDEGRQRVEAQRSAAKQRCAGQPKQQSAAPGCR